MVIQKQFPGTAAAPNAAAITEEAEQLERGIWEDMKAFRLSALEKKIAPEFQSIHKDGARNRAGELELIKNLRLADYKLSNFKATKQGDALVVTYTLSGNETIDDRRIHARSSQRMSVWRNNQGQWQWIAHANLISL